MAAAWTVLLQGCYESLPMQQGVAPETGRVVLVLNDQGRAAHSERLGPMMEKIEGQLVSQQADSYTLSVVRVTQLNGTSAIWNGEQVTLLKVHTVGYQVRRLNVARTVSLTLVVAAVTVFGLFGKALAGGGTDDKEQPANGGQPVLQRRVP